MEDINKTFKKRLFFSIAVASLMCPILGIIAIIFNFQAKIAYEHKDMDDYKVSSKITNILIICGFIVGIFTWICIIGSVSIYTHNKKAITNENNLSITTMNDCININDKNISIPVDCQTFMDDISYTLGTDIKTTYVNKKETLLIELWDDDLNVVGGITVFNSKDKTENLIGTQVIGIKLNDLNNISFKYLGINNNSNLENVAQILGDNYSQSENGNITTTSWSIDNYFINITWEESKMTTFQVEFTTNV